MYYSVAKWKENVSLPYDLSENIHLIDERKNFSALPVDGEPPTGAAKTATSSTGVNKYFSS